MKTIINKIITGEIDGEQIMRRETSEDRMRNAVEESIKEHPFHANPSARGILRKKLDSMSKYPSESKAQELEEMGFVCDYKAGDEGMEPEVKNY